MALLALSDAQHPLAGVAHQHEAMFRVAGIAGCDIQCMPYHVCKECDAPYRHDQRESRRCLVCGNHALERFSFRVSDGRRLTRVDVERDYYRNTHLVLGRRAPAGYGVDPKAGSGPPEQPFPQQVVRHLANVLRDAEKIPPRKQRTNFLAFTLGWFSHVVSDAMFKGVYPQSVRVRFFGHQYNMAMLPAAETLTMTDLAYDFGVHWPTWHRQLLNDESDGGALRHLAMGNDASRYDRAYWTIDFGKPDAAIGRVIDALRPLNRTWFHRMYLTPDYTAPSPRLDQRKLGARADWTFSGRDLGQVRAYAIATGWYETFIKGIDIYLRIVDEATRLAGTHKNTFAPPASRPQVGWTLWRNVVEEAIAAERPPDWGSRLNIDPNAISAFTQLQSRAANVLLPEPATDYQKQIAAVLQSMPKSRSNADVKLIIGPPAFNQHAAAFLCREDILRLKYDRGLAGLVKFNPEARVLHLVGLSDFGDKKLLEWLTSIARP
jgi:hypothetical protein